MNAPSFSRSLKTELMLRMAIPLGAFALMLMLVLSVSSEQREREVIGTSMQHVAVDMTNMLDEHLAERALDVKQLAWMMNELGDNQGAQRRLFDDVLLHRQEFAWIGLTDADGRVVAASGGLRAGENYAGRPGFLGAANGFHVGSIHPDAELQRLRTDQESAATAEYLDMSARVSNERGSFTGVLLTKLNWQAVENMFRRIRDRSVSGPQLDVFIIDGSDRVIAGTAENIDPRTKLGADRVNARGEQENWRTLHQTDGNDYMFAWASPRSKGVVGGLGWRVAVRQPERLALSPIRELRSQLMGGAVLLTLGILVLAWIQSRSIARPLGDIANAADAITRGEARDIPTGSQLLEVESLAQSLQRMIGELTHNERLRGELENQARSDALTGLRNRRALDLYLELARPRAQRHHERFAVFALDLDGFKAINDQHGHAAGDVLLREVAQRLERVVRSDEMLVRLGGDEFLVIISGPADRLLGSARILSERILACFRQSIMLDERTGVRVGCSVGIALGLAGEGPTALMQHADEALYTAKENGRNRAAWWPPQIGV